MATPANPYHCELTFGYRWRRAQPHHVIQLFDQDAWATYYAGLDAKMPLAAFCAAGHDLNRLAHFEQVAI